MTLRWFATEPIYYGTGSGIVRAYNPGEWVPDEIVTERGLAALGYVTQVDVSAENPNAVSSPLTSSTIRRIEVMSSAAYDALPSSVKDDPSRLYITL